jgi:Ca-activated chloride channel family protein
MMRRPHPYAAVLLVTVLVAGCTQHQVELPPPAPPPPLTYEEPKAEADDGVAEGVEGGVTGGVVGGVVGGQGDAPVLYEALRAATPPPHFNTEAYARVRELGFRNPAQDPLSTFSIDVDTASYANVRRFLQEGQLPPRDAVRIEEMVNYFRYEWAAPEGGEPFAVQAESMACPWAPEHRLVGIGLRARDVAHADVPPRNLVFLLDVSGSMQPANKLPLVKRAMALLTDTLRPEDRVAIVVYAGAAGVVLPSTSGADKAAIRAALARLEAGGSTAGGQGIQLAYRVAQDSFLEGGVNRVVLATDGDFNVGVSSPGELTRMVEEKKRAGVALTVLGFGMGNLKDSTLEQLADNGDGNYAYVDTLQEARKVLVEEAGGTLVTLARDVKIQVEFNPAAVAAYRLVGYENRMLATEDFDDDARDAGDMGAGHTVTALYEVVPVGVKSPAGPAVPLKYQPRAKGAARSAELMTVKVRYKEPQAETSQLLAKTVPSVAGDGSSDLRFASAVAELGMLLRGSDHKGLASFDGLLSRARDAVGDDRSGYRREFLALAATAARLSGPQVTSR